jgi:branched-chain amino acid transport system permease protein
MKAVVLDGIVLGLQFGLLGVGMTLVYGLGGVLNVAYGQMAVLAAMVVAITLGAGAPALVAAGAGLLVGAAAGVVLDQTLMRPVYRQRGEHRVLLGLLLTLGAAFVIDGLLLWRYPTGALRLAIGGQAVPILGVPMRVGSLLATGISLGVAALLLGLRATTPGRAANAVIDDEVGARLVGINPAAVRTLIFAASGALAALVAETRSMTSPVPVTAGFDLTILALIVAVVGGLGNVAGAFLAGVLLGIVSTVSAFYIGQYITTIVLLAAAALTIVVRPRGLLGSSR